MLLFLGLIALLVGYVLVVYAANRFSTPAPLADAEFHAAPGTGAPAGASLSVATWNIGYAGMGAEADFMMDLGEQTRPTDPALVDRNLASIQSEIASFGTDAIFVQEAAEPSYSTHRRDVVEGLRSVLPRYGWMYGAEVATRLIPPPLKASVGNMIFSQVAVASAERRALPLEPTFEYGAFRKGYRMHIARLAGPEKWVLVNVHLSTFDTLEHDVRSKQVDALLAFAQSEYAKGSRVVIGGDWNLRLADTDFPHTSEEKFLFWVRDFPQQKVPDGWQWAVDPSTPTVRGAHRPYTPGDNFTLIIDGFLVSPNVGVSSVKARDLGFEFTDHHPVIGEFVAR